ncbi:MAG: hypothetical protein II938_04000 [Alphaproteobacteria bacterium]|nr:hypothetical protein [Alphaproteobacteria bacterium]
MKQHKIDQNAIKQYLLPQLDILKALLINLHMQNSLKALAFLEYLINIEIKQL